MAAGLVGRGGRVSSEVRGVEVCSPNGIESRAEEVDAVGCMFVSREGDSQMHG